MNSRYFSIACLLCCLVVVLEFTPAAAQQPATGTPPFASIAGGPFDSVNLANLNVHFSIPVFRRPGKGAGLSYSLAYDSLVWMPTDSNGSSVWTPVPNWGWTPQSTATTGHLEYRTYEYWVGKYPDGCDTWRYGPFTYVDPAGGRHTFNSDPIQNVVWEGDCSEDLDLTQAETDGSGLQIHAWVPGAGITTVSALGGTVFTPPPSGSIGGSVKDANDNTITTNSSGIITDTIGTTALTVTGSPATYQVVYSYTAPSGGPAQVKVNYADYLVATHFNISGVTDYYYPTGISTKLVSSIVLPDNTQYTFTYEPTPDTTGKVTGRIASITLPTGGTIAYSYVDSSCTNNPNSCMMADGSPALIKRTLSQTQWTWSSSWTYSRAVQSGKQLPQTTTTVLDGMSAHNETDLNFSGIYETQRYVYSGTGGSKTLLKHTFNCYNANFTNCGTATVTLPITSKWSYDYMEDGALHKVTYDGFDQIYGRLGQHDDYGYYTTGQPSIIHDVTIAYNSSLCGGAKRICDHPSTVHTKDGSGADVGITNYSYDGSGNTTQVSRWVSGSSFLNSNYTYNSGGTLATAQDPKGTTATYSYAGTSCNSSFPTSVTVAGMTTQYEYDCRGGVVKKVTDPNSKSVQTGYTNDPYFWRPDSTTDQLGNVTYFNYYHVNNSGSSVVTAAGQMESVLTFNSSLSTVDRLTTADGMGRASLQQVREGPGSNNWDTTEYLYDNDSRVSWATLPFVGSAGTVQDNQPSTGYGYDGLNRIVDVVKAPDSQLDIHYTYSQNDVKVTVNPAPAGENTKSRQLEYDAFGRLISVCELLPGGGGSTCSQTSSQSGYWTRYQYDPASNLTGVCQKTTQPMTIDCVQTPSSGQQTRTYAYDHLSRMTQEVNPESGTTTYTYDSVGGNYCAVSYGYSSAGDLVAKADANNNHVCYWYDSLHRLTDVGSKQYSTSNPCFRFKYDNSHGVTGSYPSGVSPQNYWGRMVEAETDDCVGTILTNEWFSYSARGERTDAWEWTTSSGGWYHTNNAYAANGVVLSRSGYFGTGTTSRFANGLSYTLDGKGRPNGLQDTTLSAALWSSGSYNAADQTTNVTFSNGDWENFDWYTNSGLLHSWTSSVGTMPGNQQIGTLTWNDNRTLQSLDITDYLGPVYRQTCNYSYDDLQRLSRVDCGSGKLGQSFTYDAFGNITKNVLSGHTGTTFNPGYGTGNHVSGFGYDGGAGYNNGNGNLTNDGTTPYTYNVYGRPATVGSTTAVYDAFNRMIESRTTTGNTQLVYSPDGFKFGYMNGQAVQKYVAPLVAGVQVIYTAASPAPYAYYRHSDWLGSSRLASNANRTVYYGAEYAPFGEIDSEMGTADRNFTGQTQDIMVGQTGIYDFLLRQYSSAQGRWLVPDPAGRAAVDISTPQTWNAYAYVANNPLSAVDFRGLEMCLDGICISGIGGGSGGYWPVFWGTPFDWEMGPSDEYYQNDNNNNGVLQHIVVDEISPAAEAGIPAHVEIVGFDGTFVLLLPGNLIDVNNYLYRVTDDSGGEITNRDFSITETVVDANSNLSNIPVGRPSTWGPTQPFRDSIGVSLSLIDNSGFIKPEGPFYSMTYQMFTAIYPDGTTIYLPTVFTHYVIYNHYHLIVAHPSVLVP